MENDLRNFLLLRRNQKSATAAGTSRHLQMQHIIIDGETEQGNTAVIAKVKAVPALLPLFSAVARTEVPVAGMINGKFVSRRLDRLLVNDADKAVIFLDYKTDIDKNLFREKYSFQMNEYTKLLQNIYPDYSVTGLILWLHDFTIEKIS